MKTVFSLSASRHDGFWKVKLSRLKYWWIMYLAREVFIMGHIISYQDTDAVFGDKIHFMINRWRNYEWTFFIFWLNKYLRHRGVSSCLCKNHIKQSCSLICSLIHQILKEQVVPYDLWYNLYYHIEEMFCNMKKTFNHSIKDSFYMSGAGFCTPVFRLSENKFLRLMLPFKVN